MVDPLSVGAICTRIVTAVEGSTTLTEAARLMRRDHIGCVVAVDSATAGAKPVGILTDRDIVVTTLALDLDARQLRVEDIMTREPRTILEDEPLMAAVDAMRVQGVRRLIVTSRDGVLVGMLSLDDVLAAMSMQLSAMTEAVVTGRMREGDARI